MRLSVWHERSVRTGTYSVRYYDPSTGKKCRILCRDKTEMREQTARITSMLINYRGGKGNPDAIPIVEFENYLNAMKDKGLRPSTLSMKKQSLAPLLNSVFKLSDLTHERLQLWKQSLNKYAVDSQSIKLRDLRTFINWLVKEGKIKENPFKGIAIPPSSFVGRRLSSEELSRIYDVAHPVLKDYLVIALETGARRGEILGMEAQDINLIQKSWTIPAHKCKTRIQRTVPLSEIAYKVVKSRFQAGESVFKGVSPFYVQKLFKRALKTAEIEGRVRIHDLRHTFASNWRGTRSTLKVMCGWRGEQMLNHYTHVDLNEIREDLNRGTFGAILGHPDNRNG